MSTLNQIMYIRGDFITYSADACPRCLAPGAGDVYYWYGVSPEGTTSGVCCYACWLSLGD